MYDKKCASSDKPQCWKEINFKKAERFVKKLQRRIFVAYSQGNVDKAVTLMNFMIHSFYAKACAVRRVCSTRGRKTPGIDGVLWITDEEKFNAIYTLRLRGYKPKPLKRVRKMKPDGTYRLLGIPTMKDRAVQTLYKFALEPIMESLADEHSYGFRHGRNVKDAILNLEDYLSKNPDCEWILKSDIDSCFDSIDHEWLLQHLPGNSKVLRKILKSGIMENGIWHPTNKGVPQGGSVSSVLCNLALDGLENICADVPTDVCAYNPSDNNTDTGIDIPIRVTRYADDIIICAKDKEWLVQAVVPVVEKFLSERGLSLSDKKTSVSNIRNGVTFLGWNVSKHNGKIISVPTQRAVDSLFEKVQAIVLNEGCFTEKKVKQNLKCLIRGWLNFYSISTEPYLRGLEFELAILINRLTGTRQLVDVLYKEFKKYIISKGEN